MADIPESTRSSRRARQAAKLETALSELEAMNLDALRTRWHRLTGRSAPATFRVSLLRAAVAYKLQERAQGGLKAGTRRLLHRVADAADPGRRGRVAGPVEPGVVPSHKTAPDWVASSVTLTQRRPPAPPMRIKPGTRLLRTWQGSTHEVLVGDGSVTYRGQAYRSLSEVARRITGQRWSGPLFFGLKQRASPDPQPATEAP